MNQYLYAIADGLPAGWGPPPPGVGGAPVLTCPVGRFTVVLSPLDAVPPGTARALAAHHDVVAATMTAQAVVPFRYGMLVAATDLDAWLGGERAVIETSLAHVRGRVEMDVKLLRLDASAAARPRRGDGPAEPDMRDLRDLADHLAERAGVAEWRYRPAGSGTNVAGSVAFLVPRAEVPEFLSRIAPVASRAVGVAVVPTGPWPAYSFVPALDRPPLRRSGSRLPSAERRAG